MENLENKTQKMYVKGAIIVLATVTYLTGCSAPHKTCPAYGNGYNNANKTHVSDTKTVRKNQCMYSFKN